MPDGSAPSPGPDTVWNFATGGSTIPLEFNLYEYDGGPEITSTTGIVFDATEGLFIQNWKTRRTGRDTCYRVSVGFADDAALFAFVRLRR